MKICVGYELVLCVPGQGSVSVRGKRLLSTVITEKIKRETIMGLREDTLSPAFKKDVVDKLGTVCACCGSADGIEYHHIVPLFLGGTNKLSNIVPLCSQCHKAAHYGQHKNKYRKTTHNGRKPKMPYKNACEIFNLYANGLIGTKKCKQMLGYSESTKLQDIPSYKKYLEESGIVAIKNNVDIICTNCPEGIFDGKTVGERRYKDGHSETMTYHDTGLNDIEYRKRNENSGKKIVISISGL